MANYSIGLSGLHVAQRAIELIGTNIANATTPGYHRQEPIVHSLDANVFDHVSIGGAEIATVRRNVDEVLELEILRQRSNLAHTEEELGVLETVENAFGQLNAEDLGAAMNSFFDALTELGAQPDSQALQEQAVWMADSLAGKFRDLGRFLDDLDERLTLQVGQAVEHANDLAAEVAELNGQVANAVMRGGSGNLLRDRRDEAITGLAELVGVRVYDSPSMVEGANVQVWGHGVVDQVRAAEMSVAHDENGNLALLVGDSLCSGDTSGGQIGGLLDFANGTLADLRSALDGLALQVIQGINALHVQGVGSDGSFTELTGETVGSGLLNTWELPVAAGELNIRVVDVATGQVTRHSRNIDPTADTATDVCNWLDSLDHISASVVDGRVRISAESGYEFDFLTELTSEPYASAITGTAEASIGGAYTGSTNQLFTVTAVGTGEVGVTDGLTLEIRNGSSELVRSVNVGLGYGAGEAIDIGNGMKVTLTVGTFNDGDEFTIQALAQSDTSGFLAAAGLNTLFAGHSAATIGVRSSVLNNSGRLAVSAGGTGADAVNALAMGQVGEQAIASLDGMSPKDYFTGMRTGVAQEIVVTKARQGSQEGVLRQLNAQRDEISGVDINEEAAKLLVFERMYQAISKAIATQDEAMKYLFNIL